ncbi:MAG: glycosyltransferase, partial [bacterium]|nr:glycosyltransferase [bacterium]
THKCFYLSKINLNSHIRPDGVEYFNERTFQVLGSGGFLLTDHVCKAQDVFAIDKEISTYSNYDELAAKVKYYLDNDEMRKKIAENGHARSIKDFSWRSWAEKIIREMRQLKNV